jgi:hypothetical protein
MAVTNTWLDNGRFYLKNIGRNVVIWDGYQILLPTKSNKLSAKEESWSLQHVRSTNSSSFDFRNTLDCRKIPKAADVIPLKPSEICSSPLPHLSFPRFHHRSSLMLSPPEARDVIAEINCKLHFKTSRVQIPRGKTLITTATPPYNCKRISSAVWPSTVPVLLIPDLRHGS